MAGETNIGGIVGYLRLDHAQFVRAIDEAIAKTEYLDGKNVDIRVDVDRTGAAAAQLDKIAVEATKAEKSVKQVDSSSRSSGGGVGVLATAIGTLGPALVPVAAGAVGLAGGFTMLGAAGLIAFKGIKNEMAQNTAIGAGYQDSLTGLSISFDKLAATAAKNVLGPFQAAIADVQSRMPALNGMVDEFSTMTGNAGSAIVSGLVSALVQLEPMLRDAGVYVVDLSRRFQDMMSGSGVVSFGDYVRSVFPQVMQTVESLVEAAIRLVAAFAPLGGGTLSLVKMLADVINSLDPGALAAVATAAGAVFLGFRSWQGLSALVSGLGGALESMGLSAEAAATGVRSLQIASGVIGIAIAGLSLLLTSNAEKTRQVEQATNDYADALRRSNGVIDESIVKMTAKKLADEGVIDAGRELGYNLKDLTDAALGNADAQKRVADHTQAVRDSFSEVTASGADVTATYGDVGGKLNLVTNALGVNNSELQAAIQKNRDLAAATGETAGTLDLASEANQRAADRYGITAATLDQVTAAQQKTAEQTEVATAKMQAQGDAAGLLKLALDQLNGKQISNEEAINAYDRAGNALASPIVEAQKALASAQKQASTIASQNGHTSSGGGASVAKAQLALTQAQDHLARVQANGKHTAEQLASAQDRVETATLRLSTAQAGAAKVTGAATQAQKDSANAAVAQARANLAAQFTLDGSSEAAVRNRDNIINMVKAASVAAGTNGNLASSSEVARQKFIQMRDDVLKQATALGFNKDQVQELLDKIAQVPDHATPTKYDQDTAPATRKVQEFIGVINGVPTWKTTTFKANTSDALAAVANIREAIAGVRDKTVTIAAVYGALGQQAALSAHNALTLDAHHVPQAQGSIRMDGVQKMAQGGFAGRESTIMRSTRPILWNEAPGGEAYISLAPEKRARSLAIHAEVGKLIGAGGDGGGRLHPDDIGALARALGREISRMPAPELGLNQLDKAWGV